MKILAVTGTRADWGLLVPLLDLLRDDKRFSLEILATGQHLMPGYKVFEAIAADGHQVTYQIDMGLVAGDNALVLAHAMGMAVTGMGDVLAKAQPDLVLVLGDRYEILSLALAAVVARVPIAHLCGGDVTEGAMDDSIRHALTKLAALHFPSNDESAARIIQMGEDPAHVHTVGSTGIDRILAVDTLSRETFFHSVGLEPAGKTFVVTFHPATLSDNSTAQAQAMLDALDRYPDAGLIFTGSNADPGARDIDALIQAYVSRRDRAVFHVSLGSQRYFSALHHCNLVIGNSSSGLLEAPSFCKPTVNIGDRQAGRPRAASVIDCAAESRAICDAINKALALDMRGVVNPYGDGHSAARIVAVLAAQAEPRLLIRKSFRDIAYA